MISTTGRKNDPLLVEVAWEVVNQVGGIYTVIRSKLPAMDAKWAKRYCVVGPYMHHTASVEFEPATPTGAFGQAVKKLREMGIGVHYGHWLVTGRPRAVLLDLATGYSKLNEARGKLWHHHNVPTPHDDQLINDVVTFGYLVEQFLAVLADREAGKRPIIAHFHEWMGAAAIPEIRRRMIPITTVFTTHATMLGRYIAANDPWYYDHVPFVDWLKDARRFLIEPQVTLERAAAHGAQVLTTVSNVTAFECEHLLGRKVDVVTPNGLNIERFVALHQFQNLHNTYKAKIHEFTMSHFFPSYAFDLDKTLYFFTSGRYEYRNKGFDMTLEALARLNWRLKQDKIDRTVVFFLVTRKPYRCINANELSQHAIMDELKATCDAIKEQIGEKLFTQTAMGRSPEFNELVDEYWRLRLRRTRQAWGTGRWPAIVTHDLVDDRNDEVLNQIRTCKLLNDRSDPVKVVYHPEFIQAVNPLWGLDYDQFVRGCHAGVFPSYYEPWGYTPLECMALGIPSVTSDVSGFGSYVIDNIPNHEDAGLYVVHRRYADYHAAVDELANHMYNLTVLGRRDRIALRNKVDRSAEHFDWTNLVKYYDQAHDLALQRMS
ncbi:MAG: glycosyltransferase [Planctomycetes bacterium]|nr:glycosyltransferase [Planctomycetota bacterium]